MSSKPRERIYLASPLSEYFTHRAHRAQEALLRSFPGAEQLPAQGLYRDSADWLARWPRLAKQVTALAFIAAPDGSIGHGVYQEIQDMRRMGKPVYYVAPEGALIPYKRLHLVIVGKGANWHAYAQVHMLQARIVA